MKEQPILTVQPEEPSPLSKVCTKRDPKQPKWWGDNLIKRDQRALAKDLIERIEILFNYLTLHQKRYTCNTKEQRDEK